MSKRRPIEFKQFAVVFKWFDQRHDIVDVQEYFDSEKEAKAYLRKLKGKLPNGVEYAEVRRFEI